MLSHIASSGRLLSVQRTRNFNVAALERYRIIRNFFRNQHTVAPETSRCLAKPPKFTRRQGYQENGLIYNQRRYFHPSVLRPFAISQCSENSPQTHEAARSRDSSNQEPNPPPTRNDENYSRFFQRLALSLPHLHRPTRDDFLKVATGFWQRMRIRFKWFTIKSFRKFNADDISAFITWFVMSQTLWILIGT